jgi:hypothetical protein
MQACAVGYALIYFNYSETAVNRTVVGLTAVKFKLLIFTFYAWLFFVQHHVYLDFRGLGLLLPVSCII